MMHWSVEFYRDADGAAPVREWMLGLPDPRGTARARIDATLIRLRERQGRLPEPYAKHLRGKLWELRWIVEGAHLRMIYANVAGRIILLLAAFRKTSRKTPPRELELAERRLKDWSNRHEQS